ncbi:MAG TPA: NAD(P)-dependent oxidoreductase [Alphaproteobacteria bacterium]|nr:NAD(P)-dependent oxidoreductase [Alphaproteobacteria bacterium]
MVERRPIGFIGLGVMGEPMCANLVRKCGVPVIAYDIRTEPLARLAAEGVRPAASAGELAREAGVVMLSLPSGNELRALAEGEEGLLALCRRGQLVVDLGTSPVGLTRALAERFAGKGADYADAPVARTREAAKAGTLSIMVGASKAAFRRLEPLLACFASDITHCGEVGAGQVVKLVNNMVLFEIGTALGEGLALARRAGVGGELLFSTLAKGSADSFALRNHGMKAMLPGIFPERAFSAEYALKDVSYALELAEAVGLDLRGASLARTILGEAIAAGHGALYWPVIAKLIGARGPAGASPHGKLLSND